MIGSWVRIASGVRAVRRERLGSRSGLAATVRTPEAMRTQIVRLLIALQVHRPWPANFWRLFRLSGLKLPPFHCRSTTHFRLNDK